MLNSWRKTSMNSRFVYKFILGAVGLILSAVLTAPAAEEGYPLREKFPNVKFMTTEALNRDYQSVIIVDVRSKIEYDVIHINKAVHLPIATAMFIKDLEKVRPKTDSKPMAFYCNGHTCAKSYEAAEQAMQAGFQSVFAYDAGIYDWVKAHPDKGTLMGKSPVPLDKLISHEALGKKKINYDEFQKRAKNPDVMVIDIREPFQRKAIPEIPSLRNIPSDRFAELIKTGEFKGKELLILDAVGKQVEWIQYYLEMYGYSNYIFLDKGVDGYLKSGK
jgi:rhodanese-related sulfurtransferase